MQERSAMMQFEWSEELDVNVTAMNDEHRKLISLMRAVHEAFRQNADRATVWGTLNSLNEYAKRHFANEEAYMESVGFAGLEEHRRMHTDILDKIGTALRDFENRAGTVELERFCGFLKWWLIGHIKMADRRYAPAAGGGRQA